MRRREHGIPATLCCPFNVVYIQPDGPGSSDFARGRFSRVSRAIPAPPSPPLSPRSPSRRTATAAAVDADSVDNVTAASCSSLPAPGTLLAVKRPATGTKVETASLQAEAAVLSYISARTELKERREHIVNFYGFMPQQNALVLDMVDLTLEKYILDEKVCSAASSSDPVIGLEQWLHLTLSLTKGLEWLHQEAGVVHGDIKPANVMLRAKKHIHSSPPSSSLPEDSFPYHAIYADFGSAHILSLSLDVSSSSTFSVGTPAFTAPELLSLRSPVKCPTKASDVFSLAATLVAAITGDVRLYEISSTVAMYHMAQNGHLILDNVRNSYPMRLLPRSMPVQLLKGAVAKSPEDRWTASEWTSLVQHEISHRPS